MLLSYAQRVAKHTLSPLNANAWVIEPPIPQDNHMRMSLLFQQDVLFATEAVQGFHIHVETSVVEPTSQLYQLDLQETTQQPASKDLLDLDLF